MHGLLKGGQNRPHFLDHFVFAQLFLRRTGAIQPSLQQLACGLQSLQGPRRGTLGIGKVLVRDNHFRH